MAKLALKAAPTFKAQVGIPVAGSEPVLVEFTFKHRTKTALDEFIKSRPDQSDIETFMAMIESWDLEDPFCEASVEELLENYIGSALAVYRGYVDNLVQAKVKN